MGRCFGKLLVGGTGYDKNGDIGALNDLWQYSQATGEWTWMGGSDIINQGNMYGIKDIGSITNIPGARNESISWTDNSGYFWLFGGYGRIGTGDRNGRLNDLWKIEFIPGAVDKIYVYKKENYQIRISWPGDPFADEYWIDVSTDTFKTYEQPFEQFVVTETYSVIPDLDPEIQYFIRIKSSNELGESPYSDTLTFVPFQVVGLEENIPARDFNVYPNPARSELHIEYNLSKGEVIHIQLIDIIGKARIDRKYEQLNDTDISLDVSNLISGIYILKIHGKEITISERIIVRKDLL